MGKGRHYNWMLGKGRHRLTLTQHDLCSCRDWTFALKHGPSDGVVSPSGYHAHSYVRGHGCKLGSSHVDPALLLGAEE